MATLTDSDGEVINVSWTWYALNDSESATIETVSDGSAAAIKGETSGTYSPGAGDIGKHLVAVASYMDRTEDENNNDVDNTAALMFIRFNTTVADLIGGVCSGIVGLWLGGGVSTATSIG